MNTDAVRKEEPDIKHCLFEARQWIGMAQELASRDIAKINEQYRQALLSLSRELSRGPGEACLSSTGLLEIVNEGLSHA